MDSVRADDGSSVRGTKVAPLVAFALIIAASLAARAAQLVLEPVERFGDRTVPFSARVDEEGAIAFLLAGSSDTLVLRYWPGSGPSSLIPILLEQPEPPDLADGGIFVFNTLSQTERLLFFDFEEQASQPIAASLFPLVGLDPDTEVPILDEVVANDSTLLFTAFVDAIPFPPASVERGLWRVSLPSTSPELAFREGDDLFFTPHATIGAIGGIAINRSGRLVFAADVTDVSGTTPALWLEEPSWPTPLPFLFAGDAAGGATLAGFPTSREQLGLNDAGDLAFVATVEGGDPASDQAVVGSDGAGGLALVARAGSEAPGTNGALFDSLSKVVLSSGSWVVFPATLRREGSVDQTNDSAIWAAPRAGFPRLVAREGDDAAGAPGFVFDDVAQFAFQTDHRDRLLLQGRVRSADGLARRWMLWVCDLQRGSLDPLLQEGDSLPETDGNPITVISAVSAGGGEDGRGRAFNDRGEFGLGLVWRDLSSDSNETNSSMFRASLPEVDVTTGAAIAALTLSGIVALRRV
jgi:hypothetical protein